MLSLTTKSGDNTTISFENLLSGSLYTLLYFYPKDNTPGCTIEAQDFSELVDDFATYDVQIIGVSKDSHQSHCKFIDKHSLTITLVSDEDLSLHKKYGAWWEKKMYWKTYEGVIRSTFLLDSGWSIVHSWKNVRAKWHASLVLDYVTSLL